MSLSSKDSNLRGRAPVRTSGDENKLWPKRGILGERVETFIFEKLSEIYEDKAILTDLVEKLQSFGVETLRDVGERINEDTFMDLSPTLPISVLALLADYYCSKVLFIPEFGEANKSKRIYINKVPLIWIAWRRMLADIFFFFEYYYEEGYGEGSKWASMNYYTKKSGQQIFVGGQVTYQHAKNVRLCRKDRADYYGRIAVKDDEGIVRIEILQTVSTEKAFGDPQQLIQTLPTRTKSQRAFLVKDLAKAQLLNMKETTGPLPDEDCYVLEEEDANDGRRKTRGHLKMLGIKILDDHSRREAKTPSVRKKRKHSIPELTKKNSRTQELLPKENLIDPKVIDGGPASVDVIRIDKEKHKRYRSQVQLSSDSDEDFDSSIATRHGSSNDHQESDIVHTRNDTLSDDIDGHSSVQNSDEGNKNDENTEHYTNDINQEGDIVNNENITDNNLDNDISDSDTHDRSTDATIITEINKNEGNRDNPFNTRSSFTSTKKTWRKRSTSCSDIETKERRQESGATTTRSHSKEKEKILDLDHEKLQKSAPKIYSREKENLQEISKNHSKERDKFQERSKINLRLKKDKFKIKLDTSKNYGTGRSQTFDTNDVIWKEKCLKSENSEAKKHYRGIISSKNKLTRKFTRKGKDSKTLPSDLKIPSKPKRDQQGKLLMRRNSSTNFDEQIREMAKDSDVSPRSISHSLGSSSEIGQNVLLAYRNNKQQIARSSPNPKINRKLALTGAKNKQYKSAIELHLQTDFVESKQNKEKPTRPYTKSAHKDNTDTNTTNDENSEKDNTDEDDIIGDLLDTKSSTRPRRAIEKKVRRHHPKTDGTPEKGEEPIRVDRSDSMSLIDLLTTNPEKIAKIRNYLNNSADGTDNNCTKHTTSKDNQDHKKDDNEKDIERNENEEENENSNTKATRTSSKGKKNKQKRTSLEEEKNYNFNTENNAADNSSNKITRTSKGKKNKHKKQTSLEYEKNSKLKQQNKNNEQNEDDEEDSTKATRTNSKKKTKLRKTASLEYETNDNDNQNTNEDSTKATRTNSKKKTKLRKTASLEYETNDNDNQENNGKNENIFEDSLKSKHSVDKYNEEEVESAPVDNLLTMLTQYLEVQDTEDTKRQNKLKMKKLRKSTDPNQSKSIFKTSLFTPPGLKSSSSFNSVDEDKKFLRDTQKGCEWEVYHSTEQIPFYNQPSSELTVMELIELEKKQQETLYSSSDSLSSEHSSIIEAYRTSTEELLLKRTENAIRAIKKRASRKVPKFKKRQQPMEDDELVIRFFGMKDFDSQLKVGSKILTGCIEIGPFIVDKKKNKLVIDPNSNFKNPPIKAKVHRGFYKVSQSIHKGCLQQHGRDLVDHIVHRASPNKEKRIVFTGHSMGAALAAITAYQLITRYPAFKDRLFIIQFGSPKYARKAFYHWLNDNLQDHLLHIWLEGDNTPNQPKSPPFFGWYLPGEKVEIRKGGMFGSKDVDEFGNKSHYQYW
eukprot:CAMPEP_0174256182 /NCGR_PEP_ID=MMETSP0439-20130205/5444_1 /TAXON_ID=0 /ORGANISM="Stereomyxa ramosa, Strain Chinc5" /LENGTH=1467 /DNA_ID=CAMNT_0015338689 /DNA_START=187 /DNA_END=4587 /DNA_ORIENTATION=+